MCGIAGQVALLPSAVADATQVARMFRALTHRRLDGDGTFTDPPRPGGPRDAPPRDH